MQYLGKLQSFIPEDSNISDIADIKKVIEAIPELFWVPPAHVYKLWKNFSRERCASWLVTSPEMIKEFYEWLD